MSGRGEAQYLEGAADPWLEGRDQKQNWLHETLRHSQQEVRGRNSNIFENL